MIEFRSECLCGYISHSREEAWEHEPNCSVMEETMKMLEQNQGRVVAPPSCFCSDIHNLNVENACHKTVLMRNRKDRTRILVLDTYCGRWDCSYCGSKLREKWESHINYLWEVKDIIFKTKIKPSGWASVYAWIRRHEGNYIRIKQIDGSSVVFSTVSPGTWEMLMSDITQQEALEEAFFNIEKEHKPISTSRKWKLSISKTENKEKWERVDIDLRNKTVGDIKKVFEEEGLMVSSFTNGFSSWCSKGLEITIPEDRFDEIMGKIEEYSDPYCVFVGKSPHS